MCTPSSFLVFKGPISVMWKEDFCAVNLLLQFMSSSHLRQKKNLFKAQLLKT